MYKDSGNIITPGAMNRMQLGCALEHAISQRLMMDDPKRYTTVGELTCEGIHFTIDLLDIKDDGVCEMKLTWMSANTTPEEGGKFWKYYVQIKAYCYAWGCDKARLHICFVNGTYSGDRSPEYKVYLIWFTRDELVSNWRMLLQHYEMYMESAEENGK